MNSSNLLILFCVVWGEFTHITELAFNKKYAKAIKWEKNSFW